MRALLDTSVLIGEDAPADVEASISVASITEFTLDVADFQIIDDLVDARRP